MSCVEAFGAKPDFYVDSAEPEEKLDDEGISLVRPRVSADAISTAWLTHDVEEVSVFERLLPPLYAARPAG